MRSLGVSMVSVCLTAAVVAHAYHHKRQFYPAVVYITKSNFSMAVIYVQALIMVLLIGKLMKKVFFGQLRATEFEHLMERSWYALTETALAFTVFKDDFNPKFIAFFTILLFLKSFHWLAEDRVDFMERSPVIGSLFHIRVQSLLLTLAGLDIFFIFHAYQTTVTKGASVQLVYGFEYCILIIMIVNIFIKYIIHAVDSQTPWENKAVVLLYTEFIVGMFKVLLYISFVIIMIRKYTLPLFAFRQMYYTIRNFNKAFNDVIMSRRAIRNMNTLYPDASAAELAAVDNVCIICREEMTSGAKKLPCNHIFHASCLRSWFQRQQTCPTCRLNILRSSAPVQTPAPAAAPMQAAPAPPTPPTPSPQNAQAQSNSSQQPTMQPGQMMPPSMPMPPGMMPNLTPFMGLPWPPPSMPPNLSTFTEAELSRMEGRERQNIEARIQCLKNIQVMLDASVMMMQQYSAVANRFPYQFDKRDVETQTVGATSVPSSDVKSESGSAPKPEESNMEKPSTSSLLTVVAKKEPSDDATSSTKSSKSPDVSKSTNTENSTETPESNTES
ncbi:septin interacting protein 3 isoform X2 [Arctopsyche grandis]|uniref:septin interacting protein 3 isoform X2 n=1 Tax=Arctopsyche grandis TaxID=121162 RepID=UPI00406D95CF